MRHPSLHQLTTVLTTSRRPTPILPVDYSGFLVVQLPQDFQEASLEVQLTMAEAAVGARGERHYFGPFGYVSGHEAPIAPNTLLYLDRAGAFLDWEPLGIGWAAPEGSDLESLSSSPPQRYVVGHCGDVKFYALLPAHEGLIADKSNLEDARQFVALADAVAASVEHGGNVFEIVNEGPDADLRELLVDLHRIERLPFEGAYYVGSQLLVGRNFVGQTVAETRERVAAMLDAGIGTVVSLVDRSELFWMRRHLLDFDYRECFDWHIFPLRDGAAPSPEQMAKILDVIDAAMATNRQTYLHCMGGRGRSGTVVGCLLSRHDIARGVGALNKLSEMRFQHGLFRRSPETEPQRQTVISWRKGQ